MTIRNRPRFGAGFTQLATPKASLISPLLAPIQSPLALAPKAPLYVPPQPLIVPIAPPQPFAIPVARPVVAPYAAPIARPDPIPYAAAPVIRAASPMLQVPVQQAFAPTRSQDPAIPAFQPAASLPPDFPQAQEDDGAWSFPTEPRAATERKSASGVSTALALVPKASLWKRLLAFLGFGKATMGGEGDIAALAGSVVRRARNGDQNAMALIARVRDNAQQGSAQARKSFAIMKAYIEANPVGRAVTRTSIFAADAVALSHGKLLSNPRIEAVLSRFNGEEQAALRHGMKYRIRASDRAPNPRVSRAIRMGKLLGEARRLQAVRMPGSSLSRFDANVGWELGE